MVTIKYYPDPTKPAEITAEFNTVADFLLSRFTSRDEFLDLRFFDEEILGHELRTSDGEFLDINDGTVAITHDSMLPRDPITIAIAVFVVVMTATILLMPSMPRVNQAGTNQKSATNRLGDTRNEPRINQRIDDIFGTVTKHMPPLWQVPYRIGVNNQETEVLFLCVGRGRYAIDPNQWFDGDTPVKDIPGALVNVYSPGTHPGAGSPSLTIGGAITEKIGIYRQSNDLNPTELPPPNDKDNTGINWLLRRGPLLEMQASFVPEGFDFFEAFKVGDEVRLHDFYHFINSGTLNIYDELGNLTTIGTTTAPVDLGIGGTLVYYIADVEWNKIILSIPFGITTEVLNAWNSMTTLYVPPVRMINITTTSGLDQWTQDETVLSGGWYWTPTTDPAWLLRPQVFDWRPSTGGEFNPEIGPIFLPKNSTEVLMNFVSANGFYKMFENNETRIFSVIRIKISAIDDNGNDLPGAPVVHLINYSSNENTRESVFQTVRLPLPFTRCKVSAERLTDRDKRKGVSNVDNIEWRDLYSFEPVNVSSFGNVTTAHVIIPSNSQSRLVKDRKQNVTVTRLITRYLGNGKFGSAESFATSDFDQILIHTMLDPFIGRMSLSNIAADAFMQRKTEIINYFGSAEMVKFGYNFDTTEMTAQDTFVTICDAVMCLPYVQAGIYDMFFEKAQTVSSMQVTCRNKIPESEIRKLSYDQQHDGVEITYRSNVTGASDTIYIPSDRSALNPTRKELRGVTTALQAYRYGARIRNKQIHQLEFIKFEVDEFGRNIIPGKRIDSPDGTRFTKRADTVDGYRVFDGEVIEVNGLTVELSEPVVFTPGENHYIIFTRENGDNSEPILVTPVTPYHVLLSTLPAEPIYDGYNRDRTKFTLMSEQLRQSVALLPQTIETSINDDGTEIITVNATNYSAEFYKNDLSLPE